MYDDGVTQNGRSVFLSYRRDSGAEIARLLQTFLEQRGFRVFLDVDQLGAGHFDKQLLNEIHDCDYFLLVCARGCLDRCSSEDDWIRREIAQAILCRRQIIPIFLPGFSWPARSSLPLEIADIVEYNAFHYSHAHWRQASQHLLRLLSDSNAQGGGAVMPKPQAARHHATASSDDVLPDGTPVPKWLSRLVSREVGAIVSGGCVVLLLVFSCVSGLVTRCSGSQGNPNRGAFAGLPRIPVGDLGIDNVNSTRPLQLRMSSIGSFVAHEGTINQLKRGDYEFPKDSTDGFRTALRSDDIAGFHAPEGTIIIRLNVTPGQAAVDLNELKRQFKDHPLLLVDEDGRTFQPIGFLWDQSHKVRVRFDATKPITRLNDLPSASASGDQTLHLIFALPPHAFIKSMRVGDVPVGSCDYIVDTYSRR
jgi:hypothetical protein